MLFVIAFYELCQFGDIIEIIDRLQRIGGCDARIVTEETVKPAVSRLARAAGHDGGHKLHILGYTFWVIKKI